VTDSPDRFAPWQPSANRISGRDGLLELQNETGARLEDLVAISREVDPFYRGTETDWLNGRWVTEEATRLGLIGAHMRAVHYAFISNEVAMPSGKRYGSDPSRKAMQREQATLGLAIAAARELRLLPRDAFPDRKSVLIEDSSYLRDDYREPLASVWPGSGSVPTLDVYVPDAYPASVDVLSRPTSLQAQPITVEILSEKDGILDHLRPLARRYGCRLTVPRGFTGKTQASEILDRALADGRPLIVLMFHDADSSGESMGIATGRHLEFYVRQAEADGIDVPPIFLDVVGITLEQVGRLEAEIGREIPRAPDVRRDEGRVELDALPYFAPGWIEEELLRRLQQLWGEVDETELDQAIEQLEEDVEQVYAPTTERLDEIITRARELLGTPEADRLRRQLQELQDEAQAAICDADRLAAELNAALPDPDVDGPDLDAVDWLLDTRRDYLTQLNAYRGREPVHRRRAKIELGARPPCPECGRDMRGKKSNAKYCGDDCRVTAGHRQRREAHMADRDQERSGERAT
jgi:vacuolar-type H+-ATPase subunit H